MPKKKYSEDFFSLHLKMSLSSAENVIPVVLEFVQPRSVIDIGCGTGAWLKAWKKNGVQEIKGVDGDYVNKDQLMIESSEFVSWDLTTKYTSKKKYDLVCSLEVAEHIDKKFADVFVDTLCSLGDIILFSAAIPGQQGTHHVNEQYPDYWAVHFGKKGFVAVDCIRPRVWDNSGISWWYRQNTLFFINKKVINSHPKLKTEVTNSGTRVLRMVHPELLDQRTKEAKYYKKNLDNVVRAGGYYIKKIIKK